MNENPAYGYHSEDYIDGYLNGLKTAKTMNRAGDWIFLTLGITFGLVGALIVNAIVT